jgi:hypothetical protein
MNIVIIWPELCLIYIFYIKKSIVYTICDMYFVYIVYNVHDLKGSNSLCTVEFFLLFQVIWWNLNTAFFSLLHSSCNSDYQNELFSFIFQTPITIVFKVDF